MPTGQHTQHGEPAAPTQLDAAPTDAPNYPRSRHFLHAFSELFHESERFLQSSRSSAVDSEQHVECSKALDDVLRNQKKVLVDLQEEMQHVWVSVGPSDARLL